MDHDRKLVACSAESQADFLSLLNFRYTLTGLLTDVWYIAIQPADDPVLDVRGSSVSSTRGTMSGRISEALSINVVTGGRADPLGGDL